MARKIKVEGVRLNSNHELQKKSNQRLPIWAIILISFFVIPFVLGMIAAIISPIINGFRTGESRHENKIENEMKCGKHILSFRDIYDNLLMTSDILLDADVATKDGMPVVDLQVKDKDKFYEVTKKVSEMGENANYIVIWLDYNEETDSYIIENEDGTKSSINCDGLKLNNYTGTCISAATVNEAFSSDVVIQGNFTFEEAKEIVDKINCSLR